MRRPSAREALLAILLIILACAIIYGLLVFLFTPRDQEARCLRDGGAWVQERGSAGVCFRGQ